MNFSKITIKHKRDEIARAIGVLQHSLDSLKDQRSNYAEHHQHVINTYRLVLEVLDTGMTESNDIGKGI